ncbi:MAG: PEGA domain-containing protein [Holophaga sp.]|nr:PEGA domain-containing protein [Holophaga sp.]
MPRPLLLPLLFTVLAAFGPLGAQDSALKDTFLQAKAAWATQGDRETASAKFGAILAALEPGAARLDPAWTQVLCETYNWMAILDDRIPSRRERAPRYLDAALALNSDFEIDRNITNTRLQNAFDTLRAGKFGRLQLTLEPAGGTLSLDGRPRSAGPGARYLPPGSHTVSYAKPGYAPAEQRLDLALKETKGLELKLVRTSSVITLFTTPPGAEVLLDGKSQGATQGQAPPDLAPYAEKLGVRPDQLSAGFRLAGMAAGKHRLELRLPCYQSKILEIGEAFTTPFADHDLEPVRLLPSRSLLSVQSAAPGGELFLSGKSYGPVPVKDLEVCAQACDLQVRYPQGTFAQRVELPEGKSTTLTARPTPRLTYLGFEGEDDFAGRERITTLLAGLGSRLGQVAFLTAAKGETPQACLARLQASHETELVLRARPVAGHPIHQVELLLATLTGEQEQVVVKPLESDPLGQLVARIEAPLALAEPWAGLTLLDLGAPGAEGPWVLQADSDALKSGIKTGKAILQVDGKPVAAVADVRKALLAARGGKVTMAQGEAPVTLNVTQQALELPVNAAELCYPFVLSDLRLRYLGATGDQAGLLRLQQGLALIHFKEYDKALEILRDARMTGVQGVSQGTLDYYTGVCLLHMGNVYLSETLQSFNQALKYPQATLFGPDGPLLAPLARQALEDLKP